ncbi:hypothetical protein PLESTF_000851100 [Pleodorina starrii]|nr:hypothetical protein PLESTM_001021600 [Pleodorina starrii]GLC69582.1 hypothetical protein PLESTF_000851100 [Pleodorina starrii]
MAALTDFLEPFHVKGRQQVMLKCKIPDDDDAATLDCPTPPPTPVAAPENYTPPHVQSDELLSDLQGWLEPTDAKETVLTKSRDDDDAWIADLVPRRLKDKSCDELKLLFSENAPVGRFLDAWLGPNTADDLFQLLLRKEVWGSPHVLPEFEAAGPLQSRHGAMVLVLCEVLKMVNKRESQSELEAVVGAVVFREIRGFAAGLRLML